jgi:hypothetical protein
MSEMCHVAIKKHLELLAKNFICGINGEYASIATPYTYSDFDSIELFIKEERGGNLMLTDLGGALNHLAISCGRDMLESHTDKVRQIASKHNLLMVKGEFISLCSYEDIGEAMLNLAMAAKEVDGLSVLARAHRVANFDRRLGTTLQSKGIKFRPRQRVVSASGLEFTLDFIIDGAIPALTQAVSSDQGSDKVWKTYAVFGDLSESGDPRPRIAVVEKALSQSKMSLLRKKAEVYTFGQVDEMIRDLRQHAG